MPDSTSDGPGSGPPHAKGGKTSRRKASKKKPAAPKEGGETASHAGPRPPLVSIPDPVRPAAAPPAHVTAQPSSAGTVRAGEKTPLEPTRVTAATETPPAAPAHVPAEDLDFIDAAEIERRLMAKRQSPLAPLGRPILWAALAIVLVAVASQLFGSFERTMRTTMVGGPAAAGGATAAADGSTPAKPGQAVKVVIQGLNLRTQPSIGGGVIIRKLPKGMSIELIARKPGWFKVRTDDGTVAWVVDRKGYSQLEE